METVRSFIALELSSEIQEQLGQLQSELKNSAADVKWVNPGGIHLTLKFLGSISLELIEEVKKVIEGLAGSHKSFQLSIGGLGAFPTTEHPRVIWVGIEQGKNESIKLAQDLEEGLIKFGLLPEKRPVKPHLTLGRVRSAHNRNQLKELLLSVKSSPKNMPAETLILFKSTLTPQGAIYHPLHKARLA
jgi:2'-5' RNA ligase